MHVLGSFCKTLFPFSQQHVDKIRDRTNEPSKLAAVAADPVIEHMSKAQLEKAIATTKKRMLEASKNLDFLQAAQYRDEMLRLEDLLQHTQK